MLKVILADDEEIIRDGLYNIIDWEELGFEVVGQAEDGAQAIEIVENVHPDVIITDIRMPFVNGLEFIQRIKSKHEDSYIIIISGHDEFQYAQKALQLGVYDYILKPLDIDYLKELLLKIRSLYEQKQEKDKEISGLRERAAQESHLLKEKFLKDIIYERMEWKNGYNKSEYMTFNIDNVYGCVIVVQMDDYFIVTQDGDEKKKRLIDKSLYNSIKNSEAKFKGVTTFESSSHEYIVCAFDKYKENLKRTIKDLCSEIRKRLGDSLGTSDEYTITIGIGEMYDSIQLLNRSYKEASEALVHKFVLGNAKTIYFDKLNTNDKKSFNGYNLLDEELISAIRLLNKQLIDNRLKILTDSIQLRGNILLQHVKIMITNIYIQTLKIIKELGGDIQEIFDNPINIYNRVMAHQTMEGMIRELKDFLFNVIDYLNVKKSGKFKLLIEKAKEYIKQSYADKDCCLDNVAKFVNISPCYFSVIFKQEVGETFIDYLTKVRIEKAKELLNLSGYKTYEISYLVGYNNPTYFSTTFKKYTGLSPSEYKQGS